MVGGLVGKITILGHDIHACVGSSMHGIVKKIMNKIDDQPVTLVQLREVLRKKFAAQDKRIDAKFASQDRQIDAKFAGEREYFRQLLKEELTRIRIDIEIIREKLERIDECTHEDLEAAFKDIAQIKRRLKKAETELAELKVR